MQTAGDILHLRQVIPRNNFESQLVAALLPLAKAQLPATQRARDKHCAIFRKRRRIILSTAYLLYFLIGQLLDEHGRVNLLSNKSDTYLALVTLAPTKHLIKGRPREDVLASA